MEEANQKRSKVRKPSSIGHFEKIGASATKHVINFLDPRTWVNFALTCVYFYDLPRIGGEWNPMEVLKIIANPNPEMKTRIDAFVANGFRGAIPYRHFFRHWHRNSAIKEFAPFKEKSIRISWRTNGRMGHMLFQAIMARLNPDSLAIHNVGGTINLAVINPLNLKKLKMVETHITNLAQFTDLSWVKSLTDLHLIRCEMLYDFSSLGNLQRFRVVLGEDEEKQFTFAGPPSLTELIVIAPAIEKLTLGGGITNLRLLDVSRCFYLTDIDFEGTIGTLKIDDSLEDWNPEQNYTCGVVSSDHGIAYESGEEYYLDSDDSSDESPSDSDDS
jgi:hypothetical protein